MYGCVFSFDSRYDTVITNFKFKELPEVRVVTTLLPKKEQLLDQCRCLLHDIFISEQGWQLPANTHTMFTIRNSAWMPDRKMLCDRYDYSSIWVALLDGSQRVIALLRVIPTTDDMDLLGYSNCPQNLRDWIKIQDTSVVEAQRIIVSKEYRRSMLMMYLYYHSSMYLENYTEHKMCIGSYGNPSLIKAASILGGEIPHGWRFKYDDRDDTEVQVIIYPTAKVLMTVSSLITSSTYSSEGMQAKL